MKHSLVLVLSAILLGGVNSIQAELVQFEVSATVNNVWDPSLSVPGVQPGDVITGTYTVDSSTLDVDASAEYARYPHPPQDNIGFDLILNGMSFKTDPSVPGFMYEVHIGDSFSDHYHVSSWGGIDLNSGAKVNDINLDLYSASGNGLNSTALTTEPMFTTFDTYDLMIFGENANQSDSYHIEAKLTSLKRVGDVTPVPPVVRFKFNAVVNYIWDDGNALNGSVQVGSPVNGSYHFDPNTPDDNPGDQTMGFYRHTTASTGYGFDIRLGDLATDTSSQGYFDINVHNNDNPDYDHYGVFTGGFNLNAGNGVELDHIGLIVDSPEGGLFDSVALPLTPPTLPANAYTDVYISGRGANGQYFSISARLTSLELDPLEAVVLAPTAGLFLPNQRFDLAFIFEPGVSPMVNVSAILDGMDITPTLNNCIYGGPNMQQRETYLCPDFSLALHPGKNNVQFVFELADGRTLNKDIVWEILD